MRDGQYYVVQPVSLASDAAQAATNAHADADTLRAMQAPWPEVDSNFSMAAPVSTTSSTDDSCLAWSIPTATVGVTLLVILVVLVIVLVVLVLVVLLVAVMVVLLMTVLKRLILLVVLVVL